MTRDDRRVVADLGNGALHSARAGVDRLRTILGMGSIIKSALDESVEIVDPNAFMSENPFIESLVRRKLTIEPSDERRDGRDRPSRRTTHDATNFESRELIGQSLRGVRPGLG